MPLPFNSSPHGQNGCHFGRQQFQMHFLEWKWFKFHCCSQESSWQQASIGSDNGLAPNRRQAITWTNAYPVHWCIYAALRGDELSRCIHQLIWKPTCQAFTLLSLNPAPMKNVLGYIILNQQSFNLYLQKVSIWWPLAFPSSNGNDDNDWQLCYGV